jgi:hypothetical protein
MAECRTRFGRVRVTTFEAYDPARRNGLGVIRATVWEPQNRRPEAVSPPKAPSEMNFNELQRRIKQLRRDRSPEALEEIKAIVREVWARCRGERAPVAQNRTVH